GRSCTACQRNWPSLSRKHMMIPWSPLTAESRGASLLVPTKIFPPAMTGPPYVTLPNLAIHLMFFCFPSSVLHSVGMFLSRVLTGLRLQEQPPMGQSSFDFSPGMSG